MSAYVTRRLLFMIPTLFGITLICFTLIQMAPGGPVEQYISRVTGYAAGKGGDVKITKEEIKHIEKYYGFDQPAHVRYINWVTNLCKLDLGKSYFYEEPVWDVIVERFPVSIFFGLTSFILSYIICIPLGIVKAIKTGSVFDIMSSVMVFIGYVIPSYALGVLLIIFFCGGSYFDWFPIGQIVSENFEELNGWWPKTMDFLHHMTLPLVCYMASEFAFLTILMKNSLLEEVKKDYVRTALLKGSSHTKAILVHALRNALIPLATRLSEIFTIIFASALLIEKVFDIDGMGLLFYNSIHNHDYNVVMSLIFFSSALTLLGRLFSDILYAIIDPRIRFT